MNKKDKAKGTNPPFKTTIESGNPREIPDSMKTKKALAYNQNQLAVERTELSKIRTDLAFTNSRLAADRTHLSYLRTTVSLIGSGATLSKALPLIGVSATFSRYLAAFLFLSALYFIYKDATTYPLIKRHLKDMEQKANNLAQETENQIFRVDEENIG